MRKLTLAAATAFALLSGPGQLDPSAPDWLAPTVAAAEEEDPEITSQAKLHFRLGQEAFAAGKYDLAIKELKRAYVLKRIPAILVNIAMTYRKTKDYEMAVYFYKKFLAEAPADDKQRPKIDSEIAEVEAEQKAASQPQQLEPARPAVEMAKPAPAVEAAKPAAAKPVADSAQPVVAAAKPAAGEPSKSAAAAVPAAKAPAAETAPAAAEAAVEAKPASEWAHTPIDAVPPGKAVDVRVQMPVMKGVKVKVFYRKEGQATFDSEELKRRGNEKVARLPESVAQGRTFQYYVEARDGAGTIVKSSGSEFSPNIVLIDPTARPQLVDASGVAESNEEDEPARRVKAGPSRDIENEAVSFDIGGKDQKKAMERLRAQMSDSSRRGKEGKPLFGTLGWVGVGVGGLGVAGLATGFAFLGLAARDANVVTNDSQCNNAKMKCLYFGPNPDPALNKAANPPSSQYEQQGLLYDKVGIAMAAVGGVALAAGGGLIAYDLIKKYRTEHPPAAAPKKRKVKKMVEVEEPVATLLPVIGPTGGALIGEVRF
jgi:hypothetical protein